ncbi:transposase, IS200 family [Thioploca ingrica]|uniref:Transposase, IS200 family n=1 Tax=Thioploca ingrica TaxID=40754 RepID=A0A090BVA9_9GAMM|nr:transposase, IS200 family [Thioploca ingrica]
MVNTEEYRKGAHNVTELKYHFVWKTKYAYHVLVGEIALRTRDILRGICAEKGLSIISGNVRSNHIQLLISAPASLSPAKMAQLMKGKSSYRLQPEFPYLRKKYWGQHLWSRGYFCATVGNVTEEQIKSFIKKTLIPDIEALYQAIAQALETITPDDARNSFLHRL